MVLLAGDLFHDNMPSRQTLHDTLALLREHCMGDAPVSLQIHSDQAVHFANRFPVANYLDPNLNVSLPVFSIHGNHDDPTGNRLLASLDLLSVAGLVNYFGKQSDADNIRISPILITKGDTKLALYGLGNIRDERLNRTFTRNNVAFLRPSEDADDWFSLLAIHQNRVPHGPNNWIPDSFLPAFLDLIVWGHEHECAVSPVESAHHVHITQPGSSIATALSEGESVKKHVAIVCVTGTEYSLKKIPLKTVRPFIMESIALSSESSLRAGDDNQLFRFLSSKVSLRYDLF